MPEGFDVPIDNSGVAKLLALLKEIPGAARGADASLKSVSDTAGSLGGGRRTIGGSNSASLKYIDSPYGSQGFDGRRRSDNGLETFPLRRRPSDADLLRGVDSAFKFQTASAIAQKRLEPKAEKSREQLIMDAIMTSRILPGGTLSPLVGKMVGAGLMGAPGGFGGAAAGAGNAAAIAAGAAAALPLIIGAAGVTALVGLAEAGASSIKGGSDAFWQSGGSAGELGQMMALGGPNAGAKAEGLAGRLRSGGYASAVARAHGITDLGDYATPDKATNYIKALDLLHGTKDPMERVRIARGLGLQDDAWTSDLSDSSYNDLKRSRGSYSSSDRRAEAEYRKNKEEFGNSWDSMVRTVGGGVMKGANWLWNFVGAIGGGDDDGSASSKAAASNSGGAGSPYRSVKSGSDWVGGGQRSRAAMPPGAIAQSIDAQYGFDSIKLGGFTV